MEFIALLDHASVFIFALTGALVASRIQLDIVGFLFLAGLTALGGGTTRDILLNRYPIFWIDEPRYLLVAFVAAVLVYFTAHLVESRYRWLQWLDAAALSIAVAAGVMVALNLNQPWPIVLLMGVTTGCFGGLLRDVVGNEVPLVLKQGEIYATASLGGALVGLLIYHYTGSSVAAVWAIVIVVFALRASGLYFGWSLPTYKSRPPRVRK